MIDAAQLGGRLLSTVPSSPAHAPPVIDPAPLPAAVATDGPPDLVIISLLPGDETLDPAACGPLAQQLATALAAEPCILKERNSVKALTRQIAEAPCLLAFDAGGVIIGFATFWCVNTEASIYELGSVWIHPDRRGTNLSHLLYRSIMRLRKEFARKNPAATVFSITTNPRAITLGEQVGFIPLGLACWFSTLPWELTCGPCDLVHPDQKQDCPMRRTTCQLRSVPVCP